MDHYLNKKRSFFLFSFLLSPLFIFFTSFLPDMAPMPHHSVTHNDSVLVLSFVGDLMCHSPQFQSAETDSETFDFSPVYEFIREDLQEADFTFGNLETVLAGKAQRFTGYPDFNSPDEYASALFSAGFDFLFTSNNHSFDRGEFGLLRTLRVLDSLNIPSTGTYRSTADRDSIRVLRKNGISLAIVSFTYSINGKVLPKGKDYLVSFYDTLQIRKQLALAQAQNTDLVLAYFHWGNEYQKDYSQQQQFLAEFAYQAGADFIIGSHPHVLQPIEFYGDTEGGKVKRVTVYSLGNFISNQFKKYTDAGGIFRLQFSKKNNIVSLDSMLFTSTFVFQGVINNKRQYRIIPIYKIEEQPELFEFLGEKKITYAKSVQEQSKRIIMKKYAGKDTSVLRFR